MERRMLLDNHALYDKKKVHKQLQLIFYSVASKHRKKVVKRLFWMIYNSSKTSLLGSCFWRSLVHSEISRLLKDQSSCVGLKSGLVIILFNCKFSQRRGKSINTATETLKNRPAALSTLSLLSICPFSMFQSLKYAIIKKDILL